MKLSSHKRKFLEALAHPLEPVIRVGKQGLESKIVSSVSEAFNSHELIKIKFLSTAPVEAKDSAEEIATTTKSCLVRVIGRVIVLYKAFSDKPKKIKLPKD